MFAPMNGDRARGARPAVLGAIVLAAIVALGACSGDRGTFEAADAGGSASGQDAEAGGAAADPATDAEVAEFCAAVGELAGSGDAASADDPAAAAAQFRELAATAPEEIADDLEVIVELMDSMTSADPSSGGDADQESEAGQESAEDALGMVFDPRVIRAGMAVETFMVQRCGFDESLVEGLTGGTESDTTGDSGEQAAGAGIDLDDIDAIEEANAAQSWVDKVVSTSILNDTEVQLIAADGELSAGQFTAEEALAACEAVRQALAPGRPGLSVEIVNGDVVVARGTATAACAAA